ncbi:MAG: carboxypeptidase regulatory-like domain-containing protein [Terriglobia bacterium]
MARFTQLSSVLPRCSRGSGSRCFIGALTALVLFMLIAPPESRAQILYGSLTGNVTDPSGAPVPRANVEAVDAGTGVMTRATSNARGIYLFTDLQPGMYRVTVTATGFSTAVQRNVRVEANAERRQNVQLALGALAQQITVAGAPAGLQTDRTDIRNQLSNTQISNLPLGTTLNFQSLLTLVPGVTPPVFQHSYASNPSQALDYYSNGQSDYTNNTLIDGTPVPNYWQENYIAYVPPANAIQSVNIVTGNFDADQGEAAGSVTSIVIKTGTNNFHGQAWEYNTTSSLQARNYFFYGGTVPKDVVNQFGLDLGGPILKNKLFFFVDWQRYRASQDENTITSVPPIAIRNGDLSGTGTPIYDPYTGNPDGTGRSPFPGDIIPASLMSAAALKMTSLIPDPNYGAETGIADNYFTSGDLRFDTDDVDLKVNYNPSAKATLFTRYSAQPAYIFDPQVLGPAVGDALGQTGQVGPANDLTQVVSLGGTYTFDPNLLLDANVGFTRLNYAAAGVDEGVNYGLDVLHIPGTNGPLSYEGGIPFFELSGLADMGNASVYNPFFWRDNDFLYAANLSWIKGSHSFRFGMDTQRPDLNHDQPGDVWGARGGFGFTGGLTALNGGAAPDAYNSWGDFLLGLPQQMGHDYQDMTPNTLRALTLSAYARDQWQVSKALSVNYGVRYEFWPFPTEAHFGSLNYDVSSNTSFLGGTNGVPKHAYVNVGHGQFLPRLGVAYRLNAKTVVRTGFGMSADSTPLVDMLYIYPGVVPEQIIGVNSYSAAGSLVTGIPAITLPNPSVGKFPLPTDLGTDYFSPNFRRGYVESYSLFLQRELGRGFNAQVGYVGEHGVRLMMEQDVNADGPGGGTAALPLYVRFGNSNSITDEGPSTSSHYNALQVQVTRRLGGAQLGAFYTYSKAMDWGDDDGGLTFNWGPALTRNYADAGFDRTNNFEFYAVQGLPFGHGKRWVNHGFAAMFLGGWSVSPILSAMSGTPFTVFASGASLNSPANTQTAEQVKPQVAILGGHGPGAPYFDPNAFASVSAVAFGNSGRNLLRGPGAFSLDLSLARDFKIKERFTLEFRAEAYSLTNTPEFANPSDTSVSDAILGANGLVTNLNGFDTITSATGQRQIRFGLQLSF